MLFSDVDIEESIKTGLIVVDPLEQDCVTPVGYDLRVGSLGYIVNRGRRVDIETDGSIVLEPGDTANVYTLEDVSLDRRVGAIIQASVSVTFAGLSHISTTVDPGWRGILLIQTHNYANVPITLKYKEKLCTICFFDVKSKSQKDVMHGPGRPDLKEHLEKMIGQFGQIEPKYRISEVEAEELGRQMMGLYQQLEQLNNRIVSLVASDSSVSVEPSKKTDGGG